MTTLAATVDEYAWWRSALANVRAGKKVPPMTESDPQCGFYRRKEVKDGEWFPIAIFSKNGRVVSAYKGKLCDPLPQWTWCAGHPIDEAIYRSRIETGEWPDGAKGSEEAPRPNSNMPSDPFEALKAELDDKLEQAQIFFNAVGAKLSDKMAADKAANIAASLIKLNGQADDLFEGEKAPLREKAKAVDTKFSFRAQVKEVAKKLKDMAAAWIVAEEARLKAEADAKRKIEEERIAKERAELEASDPALAEVTPQEELPLPAAEAPKVRVGGGVGNRMSTKIVHTAVITDYQAALAHFSSHSQVKALVLSLAQGVVRATKGQTPIPGIEIKEERKAA